MAGARSCPWAATQRSREQTLCLQGGPQPGPGGLEFKSKGFAQVGPALSVPVGCAGVPAAATGRGVPRSALCSLSRSFPPRSGPCPPPNLGPSSSFSAAPPGSCPPNGRGLGARGAAHEPAHPICTLAAAAVKLLAGKAAFTRGPREPPPPRGPLSEPEAEGSLCAPDPAHPSDVQPATPTYLPLAPRFSSLTGLSQRKRCSFYRSLIYCSFCFHRMSPNPTSPKLSPGFFFGTLCRFLFYV